MPQRGRGVHLAMIPQRETLLAMGVCEHLIVSAVSRFDDESWISRFDSKPYGGSRWRK